MFRLTTVLKSRLVRVLAPIVVLVIIAPLIMLVLLVALCARGPLYLFDGLRQGMSQEEVRVALGVDRDKWKIVEQRKYAGNERRPAWSESEVSAGAYSHLDCGGELFVSFVDGGLDNTWFYPDDVEAYRFALEKKEGAKFVHPTVSLGPGKKGQDLSEWIANYGWRTQIIITRVYRHEPGEVAVYTYHRGLCGFMALSDARSD